MGCCGFNRNEFSKMKDKEQEETVKKMEKEDEKIPIYISETSYDNCNWDNIINNIPCEKENIKKRKEIFKKFNFNSDNPYISFKRLKHGFIEYHDLPDLIIKKDPDPIYLAFKATISKFYRDFNFDILESKYFRPFLFYLKQYFTYLNMFKEQAKSEKRLISFEEFKKAIPIMKEFRVKIEENNAESRFNKIDINKEKKISFDDFCINIIQDSFDNLDKNEQDDIEDLKNIKSQK